MTRTAFLDRDGTINRDVDFLGSPERLELLPGARDAVRRLAQAGFRVVITTNQSGIARGYYSERDLARVHEAMHTMLDRVPLAYLHCPHHPGLDGGGREGGDAPTNGYRRACACRKPAAGMLHEAKALLGPFGVSFEGAVVIGDSARDVLMARGLPITKILVRSGKPIEPQRQHLRAAACPPDHEAADLATAVDWLLR
ncbi:MAG: D-glycero-alpha-D-manno-heptose-1,7-bisphosphate 7-phosphatase [Planctomycetota bacterium]